MHDARLRRGQPQGQAPPRARRDLRHAGVVRAVARLAVARDCLRRVLQHRLGGAPMSLINKMLQDLDERHASPAAAYAGRSSSMAQQLRPVKPPVVSEWFWYIMAVVMLFAVAWIIWLAWQLQPRPLVTDLAYQAKTDAPAASTAAVAVKPVAVAPANPKSSVDAQTAASLGASTPAATAPAVVAQHDKPAATPAGAADTARV